MKCIFLFCALMGAGAYAGHSQTIAAMAEQLIELKLFEQTTATGYQIMTTGVDSIGRITNGEYQLHSNYFSSLGYYFNLKPVYYDQTISSAWRAGYAWSPRPHSIHY